MAKTYITYVLYSDSFKRLYIGHTDNLDERFDRHNNGYVASTKPFRPYRIIYTEEFETREKAINRERELKCIDGRSFVKQFIQKRLSIFDGGIGRRD